MNKQIIRTDRAPQPIGPYSQAVLINETLYVSGQIPLDPDSNEMVQTDIRAEATRVMKNIEAILEHAGFDFRHVVKSTIFLLDMNNFKDVNDVYGNYFQSEPPARETVQVSRLPKDANVEISVIAVK
jgi:2-iminobutanoate/2-iminopropanoate deaminase